MVAQIPALKYPLPDTILLQDDPLLKAFGPILSVLEKSDRLPQHYKRAFSILNGAPESLLAEDYSCIKHILLNEGFLKWMLSLVSKESFDSFFYPWWKDQQTIISPFVFWEPLWNPDEEFERAKSTVMKSALSALCDIAFRRALVDCSNDFSALTKKGLVECFEVDTISYEIVNQSWRYDLLKKAGEKKYYLVDKKYRRILPRVTVVSSAKEGSVFTPPYSLENGRKIVRVSYDVPTAMEFFEQAFIDFETWEELFRCGAVSAIAKIEGKTYVWFMKSQTIEWKEYDVYCFEDNSYMSSEKLPQPQTRHRIEFWELADYVLSLGVGGVQNIPQKT